MPTDVQDTRTGVARPTLDVARIRADFPILETLARGKPLVYFDNAATSQKPRSVIDAVSSYYESSNANIHRGVHYLSELATESYEASREATRRFFNARHTHEIIFTRGTTEGINLVASSFGEAFVREGDEIIVSELDHHSNLVPWHLLAARSGAIIRVIPITESGDLDLEAYGKLFTDRTRIIATTWVSNALGTITPVDKLIEIAHSH